VSLTDQLVTLLRAEFGPLFVDIRRDLPRHTSMPPARFDVSRAAGIAVHHTAAETTWQAVAKYHVWGVEKARGKTEWPTIAYGIGVQAGKVYLLRDIEELGNHVWGRNEDLLSVCVMGDLTKRDPSRGDVLLVARVVRVYDKLLKRGLPVKGHSAWALVGHNTTCPGPMLRELAPRIRDEFPAAETPPLPALPPRDVLLAEAEKRIALAFNPEAALQKAAFKDGFVPNGEEFALDFAGSTFIAQRAERLSDGAVRVYHCRSGEWGTVWHVERLRGAA
jgi:hypothetical protein